MRKYLVACSIAVTLVACGNTDKKKQPEVKKAPVEEVKTPVVYTPEQTSATFKNPAITAAYTNYIAVKSGLVNSDASKTQTAAKALVEAVKTLENQKIFVDTATELAKTSDLNAQRKAFEVLTAEMKKMVEAGLASGKLYYQFCPMAFEGKGGFWISNAKEIRNPYYGDAMLNCGEVRAELE